MVSNKIAWSFSELIEYTFETVAIVPSITVVVVCEMRKLTGLNVPQSKGQCVCLAIDLLRYGIQWGLNDAHTIFNLYNPCVFLFLIQTSIFSRQYPTPFIFANFYHAVLVQICLYFIPHYIRLLDSF